MKFVFIIAITLATTQALVEEVEWENFKLKYDKKYLSSMEVSDYYFYY